ncbi:MULTISPECIES: FkbM family methyltransferase [unclassified Bradyrhizobium]|uniref:FkbM family methyltransferase n=1 Tax=unclassified Bradyrhizobium TaxID=2631580 RepID=UPI001BAB6457|nr:MULTISPECIES: FkbM family methyltransferase [unclassified Bradyrhizobium]MBR1202631.1 FkbM family methyltransferase [Bradyrhizobium sp. AUGA SZCCT0124]MBR1310800.1 FkbM family methyltransferase [Bradyrhizobium sp. AUGA SZCCT0051]MBR1339580.1 FkbM family methyltransferase [Bradyrhizobium sp. AUGA SZCCT0105]MBR1354154.1 FkbM family methyltransferase [Bradyrhizobium sp. AUGA SZCCT0045]
MSDAKRLCLNMIVKNETANLERCLSSVAAHISCWVIGDTGSTDGTQDFIKRFFAERKIPGELHSFPFHNFEQARNAALDHAYASPLDYDYLLFDDADMELVVEDADFRGKLTGPGYRLRQMTSGGLSYSNTRLVRRDADARYHGVTHEYLDVPGGVEELSGVSYIDHASGSNRVDKFERDIRLLKAALESDPRNTRYWFYLAQSLRDAGRLTEAADAYARRADMGGWDEEAWMARLQQARCLRGMGDDAGFVSKALQAFNERSQRAEPLYDLSRFHRERGQNHTAALFAEFGLTIGYPRSDILFVEDHVYKTGLLEEYSIAANYAGDMERRNRGFAACNYLALNRDVADGPRELAWSNLHFYVQPANVVLPSFAPKRIDFSAPDGYVPLNPSVTRLGDQILVAQRAVNYAMTEDGLEYRTSDGEPIKTRNFLLHLGDDLSVRSSTEILPPSDMPPPAFPGVQGFEDMRLFAWRDALWSIACVRELTPEGWCEQVLARLQQDESRHYRLVEWRKLEPEGPKRDEKNWMPQVADGDLNFLYLCDPTRVVNAEGKTLQEHPPRISATRFRGGTQLVPFDDGWLAVIHEVQWRPAERRRFYYHRFVWFNNSNRMVAVSRPFYFNRKGVEFAAGLAWHPDQQRLLVSYSVADSESWIATIEAYDVRRMLERTNEIWDGRTGRRPSLPLGSVVESVVKGQPVRFFVTNPSDAVMKFHQQGQFYESEELGLIASHYRGTGAFVDIGANVGNHAIYMSKFTNAPKIIVFEPNDVAVSILKINCSMNGCRNIDMSNLGTALGARCGRFRKETPDPDNLGHTRFFADPLGEADAIPGDSVLLDEPIELIKLDAEGMEFEILDGLRETIKRWRPTIFIEIWDSAGAAFENWCAQYGYHTVGQYQRYDGIQNYLIAPLPVATNDAAEAQSTETFFESLAPFLRLADSTEGRLSSTKAFDDRIAPLLGDESGPLPQINLFYEPMSDQHRTLMAATSSMRAVGHAVRIWTYSPDKFAFLAARGIDIRNASDVVPKALFDRAAARSEVRFFSDIFRYALLYEHGGLWMDSDVILLKPFPFVGDYFFNLQWRGGHRRHFVCGNVIYAKPFSRHLRTLYERSVDCLYSKEPIMFGDIGPKLLSDYIASSEGQELRASVFSPVLFNSIDWTEVNAFQRPASELANYLNDNRVFGLHLWTARNQTRSEDPNSLIAMLTKSEDGPPTFADLADQFNTDKNRHTGNRHSYARIYQRLLSSRRFSLRRLMEIGLCRGLAEGNQSDVPSVALWQSYFPFCHVTGVDLTDFSALNNSGFTSHVCDQSDRGQLRDLAARLEPGSFDVIIDDGSHASLDEQQSLVELFPLLADGGWYFIEDLDWQPPGEDPAKITLTKTLLREIKQHNEARSLDPFGVARIAHQFVDILFFESHYELARAKLMGGLVAIRKRGGSGLISAR